MLNVVRSLLHAAVAFFRTRRQLAMEILALRQQLGVLKRSVRRPRLTNTDRGLWVLLSRRWASWSDALIIVKPATVVKWHRAGFRRYWTWRSRPKGGRPALDPEVRAVIKRMAAANLWGAPRIHGELLKLGIQISEATVSKYLPRRRKPPSQTWRSFCTLQQNLLPPIFPQPLVRAPLKRIAGRPRRRRPADPPHLAYDPPTFLPTLAYRLERSGSAW